MLVFLFAAYVGLIKLNRLAFAAKGADRVQLAHAFTYAMNHKPRRFVRKANHAVKLMGTHALLAGAHQVRRQQPLGHRNVRALVNRTNGRSELAATVFAVIPARTHRLAAQRLHRVGLAAVRAVRTLWPADRFKVRASRVHVGENRVRQINGRGHG